MQIPYGVHMPKALLEKIPNKYEILYGFLKSTINGVALSDATKPDMPILYANDALQRISGYSEEELIGKSAKILRGERTSEESVRHIDELAKDLREIDAELIYHSKDGSPFFCNLIATPIFDENDEIRYYLTIFRNISYKEELKTLRSVLSEEIKLSVEYKEAIDEASIVSKTDLNGMITYANDSFCSISQYSRAELLGKPHNIIRHPDMPAEAFKELWETILAKKIWKGTVKNRRRDGSAYFVNATIKPILNTKGEIVEFIAIRYNITEQIIAKEEAQSALEAKSAFFAKVSHELRTPLNAIINFTEMIIEEFDEMFNDQDIKEQNFDFLNRIERNSKHLLSLINDLLDISKLEKKGLELSIVSVQKVIEGALDACMPSAKKKNLELMVCQEFNEALIVANERALLQILLNLLSNAIKFTDTGRIELCCADTDDGVRISIKDSGRGIAKGKIDKIFEAFEQSKDGDEGTGLGLKLVKDMCQAMNIDISIESEEGVGTTFILLAKRA
jgi:PAS domain S-box-containing protein